MKYLSVLIILASLSGCAYQRGYWRGVSDAKYSTGWWDGHNSGKGRGLTEKVKDLEMENAALKAANKHLLELEHGK